MCPTLLHIGNVVLPTFGGLAAVGLMLALGMSLRTARWVGLAPDAVWDAGLFAVVAAFVLSRALLVTGNFRGFLSYPLLVLRMPSLTVWGMLAMAGVTWGWLRWHRLPVLAVLDAWAPCVALVWGFLALGHFAEGSDPGLPWRFGLREPGMSTPMVPVALYGAVFAWGLAVGLLPVIGRRRGMTTGLGLVGAGLGEFGLGFLRQPDLSGVTTLLDLGQWVGLGMMVVGLVSLGTVWARGRSSGPASLDAHLLAMRPREHGAPGGGGGSAARVGERTSAAKAEEQRRGNGTAELLGAAVGTSSADEAISAARASVAQGTSYAFKTSQASGANDAV